jgi:pyruvate, orthophosphate dikinase
MVNEGLVERRAAIKMVEPGHLDQLLHPQVIVKNHAYIYGYGRLIKSVVLTIKQLTCIDTFFFVLLLLWKTQFENPSAYKDQVIATGLPASPGAAVGQVVFTAEDAETWHSQGKSVILVISLFFILCVTHNSSIYIYMIRILGFSSVFFLIEFSFGNTMQVRAETSPEDVGGMHAAAGILTERGGMTSHAAVVARGWGKCCVSGCSGIRVNDAEKVSSTLARACSTDPLLLCRSEHAAM